ncbi:MAG: SMP-30/gluconolactonase/LRE family protein [Pirellulaceae bacterium]
MSVLFYRARIQLLLGLIVAATIGCTPAETSTTINTTAAPDEETAEATPETAKKTALFVQFPEGCNTSDAMTLLADGSILVSMPNFNDLEVGSALYRVTPDNKIEKFLDLGNHPETGKPVGPLGICVGPTGDLFLADFQMEGDRQSRVLKIAMKDGKPGNVTPVITGFHVSNAVICRDGHLYVSETQIDIESKPATSGVFRFQLDELENGPVALAEEETKDPHFLAIVECHDEALPLGADGLCFDKEGNLYIGNFADGTVHKFELDDEGKVTANTIFAKADFMKSADGLFMDTKTGIILVADSRANAVRMVHPDGTVETLVQNGDTDGLDGGLDQPCEILVRGRDVIVSNMDWPVPGSINQTYNEPCTLSIVPLD